jgi:hypothetical protein
MSSLRRITRTQRRRRAHVWERPGLVDEVEPVGVLKPVAIATFLVNKLASWGGCSAVH